jgi:hypothetical protein
MSSSPSTVAAQLTVLGATAKHIRTGFTGVVTGASYFTDRSPDVLVEAPGLVDGKVVDCWFSLGSVELTAAKD